MSFFFMIPVILKFFPIMQFYYQIITPNNTEDRKEADRTN